LFGGTVGPEAEDEITLILNLEGTEIGGLGALVTGLGCTVLSSPVFCGNAAKLGELWPENLPWGTLFELVGGISADLIGLVNGNNKEFGLDFECETSGGTFIEVLCEGPL